MATTWLSDSFTGTGSLFLHVGEVGATWKNPYTPANTTTNYQLDGAGAVRPTGAVSTEASTTTGLPIVGQDYTVTASIRLNSSAGSYAMFQVYMVQDPNSNYYGMSADVWAPAGLGNLQIRFGGEWYSGGSVNASSWTPTSVANNTTCDFKLTVTADRKNVKIYLNNVLYETKVLSVAIPEPTNTMIFMTDQARGNNAFLYQIDGISEVPPPTVTLNSNATASATVSAALSVPTTHTLGATASASATVTAPLTVAASSLFDTFSGPYGSNLIAHTADSGATWAVNNWSSSYSTNGFIIDGKMRRATIAEGGTTAGTVGVYVSAAWAETSRLTFFYTASTTVNNDLYIYKNGDNPGNSDQLVVISRAGSGPHNVYVRNGAGFAGTTMTLVDGYSYAIVVDISGLTISLSFGGVPVLAGTMTSFATGYVGFGIYGVSLTSTGPAIDSLSLGLSAPSSITGTAVLDTFTGSGNLSTHVGEVGATWALASLPQFVSGSGGSLATYTLDGAGSVGGFNDLGNITAVRPSGSLGLTDSSQIIEIDFSFTGPSGLYMGFLGGDSGNKTYILNWYVEPGSVDERLEIDFHYAPTSGGWSNLGYFSVDGVARGVNHTLRVEITSGDKVIKLDGVTVHTFTHSLSTSGYFWMFLNDALNFKVSRVAIDGAAPPPPPPPPKFWIGFTGAAEQD